MPQKSFLSFLKACLPTKSSLKMAASSSAAPPNLDDLLTSDLERRAFHCLAGQFIGDALGTRYEFMSELMARKKAEKDMKAHGGLLAILGEGPFGLIPGQVTDDTELAMALARSIIRQGTFDVDDVAISYITWYKSPPFDIGNTTRNAFFGVPRGGSVGAKMVEMSAKRNGGSLSNGCLMRACPLGIAAAGGWAPERAVAAARLDCSLTHPSFDAHDAVSAFTRAITVGLLTGDRQAAFDAGLEAAQTPKIRDILEASKTEAFNPVPGGGIGYLGIALQAAFHELISGRSFHDSLVKIVKHGGDTDTNGCIAGALLGSVITQTSDIPAEWIHSVMRCKPQQRLRQYEWVDASDLPQVAVQLLQAKEF